MALTLQLTYNVAAAMLAALDNAIDAGTAAIIEIRTGAQPGPDNAATGTLLATLTMSADAFGAVTDQSPGARITANAISGDSSADATGTAAHFRLLTQAGGTPILEGSVGTSGCDMNFNTVSFTAGSQVDITALTVDMPEAA